MFNREDELYLQDMLESIRAVASYVENVGRESFDTDRKTQAATIRELEIESFEKLSRFRIMTFL